MLAWYYNRTNNLQALALQKVASNSCRFVCWSTSSLSGFSFTHSSLFFRYILSLVSRVFFRVVGFNIVLTLSSKLFFHPAKFDNFKDENISDYKTFSDAQSENLLEWKLPGLTNYEQLLRNVSLCFLEQHILKNIVASALKSCI